MLDYRRPHDQKNKCINKTSLYKCTHASINDVAPMGDISSSGVYISPYLDFSWWSFLINESYGPLETQT